MLLDVNPLCFSVSRKIFKDKHSYTSKLDYWAMIATMQGQTVSHVVYDAKTKQEREIKVDISKIGILKNVDLDTLKQGPTAQNLLVAQELTGSLENNDRAKLKKDEINDRINTDKIDM